MTNIETIRLIMQTYKFDTPMPDQVRVLVLDSRKRNLISILKKFGKYGLFTLGAVNLMFLLKKAGFSLSIVKTYMVVTATAAIVAGLITAASVVTVKKYIDDANTVIPGNTVEIKPEVTTAQTAQPVKNQASPKQGVINYLLEMKPLSAPVNLDAESRMLTRSIYNHLIAAKGKGAAFISGGTTAHDAPMLLVGSIVTLGGNYTINARLVDAKSSKLILLITEKINKDEEISEPARRIAEKISPYLK